MPWKENCPSLTELSRQSLTKNHYHCSLQSCSKFSSEAFCFVCPAHWVLYLFSDTSTCRKTIRLSQNLDCTQNTVYLNRQNKNMLATNFCFSKSFPASVWTLIVAEKGRKSLETLVDHSSQVQRYFRICLLWNTIFYMDSCINGTKPLRLGRLKRRSINLFHRKVGKDKVWVGISWYSSTHHEGDANSLHQLKTWLRMNITSHFYLFKWWLWVQLRTELSAEYAVFI